MRKLLAVETSHRGWSGDEAVCQALVLLLLLPAVVALVLVVWQHGVIDSHEAARDAGASTERRKLTYEEFVNECVTCLRAVFPDPSKVAQVNDVLSAGYMGCVAALPSTLDQLLFFIHQEDPSAVAFVSIEAMPNCMSTSIQIFVMSLNHFNLSKVSAKYSVLKMPDGRSLGEAFGRGLFQTHEVTHLARNWRSMLQGICHTFKGVTFHPDHPLMRHQQYPVRALGADWGSPISPPRMPLWLSAAQLVLLGHSREAVANYIHDNYNDKKHVFQPHTDLARMVQAASDSRQAMDDLSVMLQMAGHSARGKLAWATREDGEVWTDEDVAILLRHMNQPDYVQRCMAELMPPRNPDCIRKKMAQLPGYIPVDATESAKYRWATSEDGEVWTDEEVAILRKHINQPGYVQRCMEDLERDLGITHRTKAQIYTKMSYMPGFKPMSNVEKGQISAQARGQRPWTDEDVAILRKHMDQPGYIQRCMAELKAPRSASVISNKVNKLQVNKLEGQYL